MNVDDTLAATGSVGARVRRAVARTLTLGLAAVVAAGLLTAIDSTVAPAPEPASAANPAEFDPGYIVSDENFYDGQALDATTVQNFLLSRNSNCAAGYACLWNYRQNTPNMAGNAYCQPMGGIGAESAASIIARVGAACSISQKTLIVLLQKEQGLVTATSPSQRAFDHATGFSCPDTAPCDPAFAGFFYQVYYAARQFQVYKATPTRWNYRAGAVNAILYHPNAACGRGNVYIANAATAGLYIYTPYQPNAAAMANLYGTGDGCSSYGNRNFWRLWTDWFGPTTGDPITMAKVAGSSTVYLLGIGVRYAFPSAEMASQYRGFGAVREITQDAMNRYVDGGPVQRAVRSTDGSVWLIEPNWRFRFRSCEQVTDFGMDCNSLPAITARQLRALADVGWLNSLVLLPDGSKWLMQGGARREVPDPSVLARYGISQTVSGLSNFSIGSNQIGYPVVGTGLFTDGLGHYRASNPAGQFEFPAGTVGASLAATAMRIHRFSYERLPAVTAPVPTRMTSDRRGFVLTDGGWLEVGLATWGPPSRFTALGSGAWQGVRIVRAQPAPHFVKEIGSDQPYLMSGGYAGRVAASSVPAFAAKYGVDPTVWNVGAGAMTGIDQLYTQPYDLARVTGTSQVYLLAGAQRAPVPTALLSLYSALGPVRDIPQATMNEYREVPPAQRGIRGSDGSIYLLDTGKRWRISCGQATDLGLDCGTMPIILADKLAPFAQQGPLSALLRLQDGTIWFLQSGTRRETPRPAVLAPWGITDFTSAVGNEVLAGVPVGVPVLGGGPVTDGAGNYLAVGSAGSYTISAAAAAGTVASTAVRLRPESFAKLAPAGTLPLRATADGRSLVAVDGGWLQVTGDLYGSGVFTATPSASWNGLRVVRAQPAPHFVRERSGTRVLLVSGGVLQVVADRAAQDWISRTYGVENVVWVVADGALAGLTVR